MGRAERNRRCASDELVWTVRPSRALVAELAGLEPDRAASMLAALDGELELENSRRVERPVVNDAGIGRAIDRPVRARRAR